MIKEIEFKQQDQEVIIYTITIKKIHLKMHLFKNNILKLKNMTTLGNNYLKAWILCKKVHYATTCRMMKSL